MMLLLQLKTSKLLLMLCRMVLLKRKLLRRKLMLRLKLHKFMLTVSNLMIML